MKMVHSSVGAETNIFDSEKRRFLTGGVTVDADLVSADEISGEKILKAGTVIGKIASGLWGPVDDPVKASASCGVAGSDNLLVVQAVEAGSAGNGIKFKMVDPSGNNQALAVTIAGDTIQVSLATGAEGAITSTAQAVADAVNAHLVAKGLVVVLATESESAGTGVVEATAEALTLADGTDPLVADGTIIRVALLAEEIDLDDGDVVASAVDQARVIDARIPSVSDAIKALLPGVQFV